MPIEAELKARLREPRRVRDSLGDIAPGNPSIYRDVYYDRPDQALTRDNQELRVRTITTDGSIRIVLTYKGPIVDETSGSKPEYETEVGDSAIIHSILCALGFEVLISFEKHCVNYDFTTLGRRMIATLVTIPELNGTFLEMETLTEDLTDLTPALQAIRDTLTTLGIDEADLTTELYTEAVKRHRSST